MIHIEIDERQVRKALTDLARRVADLTPAMHDIGQALTEGMRQRISEGRDWKGRAFAPNSPLAAARKGRNKPPVETGSFAGNRLYHAAALVGRPGATTPFKVKAPEQAEAEEELLARIVALNARRSAEEAQGTIRWLRPAYQNPAGTAAVQGAVALEVEADTTPTATAPLAWPKTLREQIAAVRLLLTATSQPIERFAGRFVKKPVKAVAAVLAALADLGLAVETEVGWRAG